MNKKTICKVFMCGLILPTLLVSSPLLMAQSSPKDPTQPLNWQAQSSKQVSLNLQAIYYRQGDVASAVINGKSLGKGETVSGWKVKEINKYRVIVSKGSLQKTLKLRQALTKLNQGA